MAKQKRHLTAMQKKANRQGILFLIPSLAVCLVFIVVPMIMCIYYSMVEWDGISKDKKFVGLENFINLPKMDGFSDMIIATFTFAFGVTVIVIFVSFAVALALDKKGRGRLPRGLMRSLWFFPALLAGAVVGILWRIMYNTNDGLINKFIVACGGEPVNWLNTFGLTNVAIIIAQQWVMVGLCMVVFLAGLQAIPQDLFEAAELDGASGWQKIKYITIPMMATSITINAVTTTIASFRAYELPYLVSQGKPGRTTLLMTQRIYFYGFNAQDYGRASAIAVMLTVIIVAISLIQLFILRKREDIY